MTYTVSRYGILTAGAVVTVLVVFAGTSLAAEPPHDQGFAQRFADHFGLNVDDVQAFLDQSHQEMHNEHAVRVQEHLATLVEDGTLTADQASLLTAKLENLRAGMEALKELDPEDRRAAFAAQRDDLEQWAEENAIPIEALWDAHPPMHHRMHPMERPTIDALPLY